jgi:hypothetical protein
MAVCVDAALAPNHATTVLQRLETVGPSAAKNCMKQTLQAIKEKQGVIKEKLGPQAAKNVAKVLTVLKPMVDPEVIDVPTSTCIDILREL